MNYSIAKPILIKNGYIPLPIVPGEKRPAVEKWTDTSYTPPNGYDTYGVGIKCGVGQYPICGIDCDITNADMAGLATSFILRECGETIYRVGQAPKVMIVYRAAEAGWRKVKSAHFENFGHIELWGSGQQFVCYGTHPDTKKPYTWPSWMGDILDIPAKDLPVLSFEKLRTVLSWFEQEAAARGFTARKDQKNPTPSANFDPDDPLDKINPIGLSIEKCTEYLTQLDPDCGRDQWRNIGMALHHEFSGSPEALVIWDKWSSGGLKYKEGEPEQQWNSFGRYTGQPITAAFILKLVKKPEDNTPFVFDISACSTSRFVDDPPPIPEVVEHMLPKGIVSLFYSAGGAGKSTLILYLAVKIALAKTYSTQFLNHNIIGGKAIIITAEDPELIINRRYVGILQAIAAEMNMPYPEIRTAVDANLSILSTFGHPISLFIAKNDGTLKPTEHYKNLCEFLKSIENLHFVGVDTKTRFSPGEGLGNVTATQEIAYYEAIANTTGASIMLLHHSNKSSRDGSQTGQQAYRDATALFDSVRAAWYLRGLREDELVAQGLAGDIDKYLLLENSKNNYLQRLPDKILIRNGYDYRTKKLITKMSKEERREQKRQGIYDLLINTLQNAGASGVTQIELIKACRHTGVIRKGILTAIDEIVGDGLAEKISSKQSYRIALTPEGKEYNLEAPEL